MVDETAGRRPEWPEDRNEEEVENFLRRIAGRLRKPQGVRTILAFANPAPATVRRDAFEAALRSARVGFREVELDDGSRAYAASEANARAFVHALFDALDMPELLIAGVAAAIDEITPALAGDIASADGRLHALVRLYFDDGMLLWQKP